jgi:hypothetical protein
MPQYPKDASKLISQQEALKHIEPADIGARRLFGAGLMGSLVVEVVLGLDLLRNPLDLAHVVGLVGMPGLAGLGLHVPAVAGSLDPLAGCGIRHR